MSWTTELLLQFLIHLMMEAGLISANKNILPVGLGRNASDNDLKHCQLNRTSEEKGISVSHTSHVSLHTCVYMQTAHSAILHVVISV